MSRTLVVLFVTVWAASLAPAHGQQIVFPEPGSSLRTEFLDVARPQFESETQGQVEFVVRRLAVMRDWVFGHVSPTRPGGRPIDWRNTKYRRDLSTGLFFPEHSLFLLKRMNGSWSLVESAIGPPEPVWEEWLVKYNLPRRLFE